MGILSSLISGGLSYLGTRETNKANSAIAQRQMDFQENSYKHRYQWQVEDMKAAGLNPMLSVNSGAGAALSGANYKAENALGDAVSSALATARLSADLDNIEEDTILKRQQGYNVDVQGRKGIEETTNLKKVGKILDEQLKQQKGVTARSQADEAVRRSEAGQAARKLGTILRDINPFLDSANSAKQLMK